LRRKKKCALCNETLVHIVKQAEAQTGAGTATADMLSGEVLQGRVRYKEGKSKMGNSHNSKQPAELNNQTWEPGFDMCFNTNKNSKQSVASFSGAEYFTSLAISQLERIQTYDPEAVTWLNDAIKCVVHAGVVFTRALHEKVRFKGRGIDIKHHQTVWK